MNINKHYNILAALDASEQSLATAGYLSRFIPARNMKINLFHVLGQMPHTFWDLEPFDNKQADVIRKKYRAETLRDIFENHFDKCRKIFETAGLPGELINITLENRRKSIAHDILEKIKEGFDALVLGRSGYSKNKELVMGSVTQKLVNQSKHIPLCIVDGQPDEKKVLVAMEASEASSAILDFASPLLVTGRHEVVLFHAVRHLNLPPYLADMPQVQEASQILIEEGRQMMEPILEKARDRLIQDGLDKNKITIRIASGVISRSGAIVKEARDKDIGTIFVGRRGLSRAERFLMGRVSSKVIQMAAKKAVWLVS